MNQQTLELLERLLADVEAGCLTAAKSVGEIRTIFGRELAQPLNPPRAPGLGRGFRRDSDETLYPVADLSLLSVRWCGRTCLLGDTLPFKLFERLSRNPNRYVSHDQLLHDVWRGMRTRETIRSVVRHLKRRLTSAGMADLAAAICGRDRHYALLLNPPE